MKKMNEVLPYGVLLISTCFWCNREGIVLYERQRIYHYCPEECQTAQ